MDAILVPGGFGKRGIEGKMRAVRYARENSVPYFGICLGMQIAAIEFARNVCGLAGANSTEFDPDTPHPVIALITEWRDRTGKVERRTEKSDLGGTMRLGAQECPVEPGTLAARSTATEVTERHRHRYEVNNDYVPQLEAQGLKVSARKPSEELREMVELPAIRGSSACSSTPSSPRRRATATRCSRRSSRPRCRHRATRRNAPGRRR